jgi:hypothetical protein
MNNTQLLCTFCTTDTLESTLKKIVTTYDITFDTIYVLDNMDTPDSLCCTYNINMNSESKGEIPDATISLHRKKSTNTLYTINALNLLIAELNGGYVDKGFKIPWDDYRNTILVTAYNRFKKITTKLNKIVKVQDILIS